MWGHPASDWSPLHPQLGVPLRLLCGALLLACNAAMWTFFSKALRHCSSSARATVTTTASNFISSVSFLFQLLSLLPAQILILKLCFVCVCAGRPGEADLRREPRSSVVGGHLPHPVWPHGASRILGPDRRTRGKKIQMIYVCWTMSQSLLWSEMDVRRLSEELKEALVSHTWLTDSWLINQTIQQSLSLHWDTHMYIFLKKW